MGKSATEKQYSFEDAARFICKGDDPPDRLAPAFRLWIWPMERIPGIEPKPPLTRKSMVDALKALSSSAETILGGLGDSRQMAFVMAAKYPSFDRVSLIDLLRDFKQRCDDSIASPALSSGNGHVKRGRGQASGVDAKGLRLHCAGLVLLAWWIRHGTYPGSRNNDACEAAEALFRLASAPAGKPETQPHGSNHAKNPLTAWRRPFEVARAGKPILGPLHDIILGQLRQALAVVESPITGDD